MKLLRKSFTFNLGFLNVQELQHNTSSPRLFFWRFNQNKKWTYSMSSYSGRKIAESSSTGSPLTHCRDGVLAS